MVSPLGLPLLTSSSGLPENPNERAARDPMIWTLFPYLTLLRVEIARFTPSTRAEGLRHCSSSAAICGGSAIGGNPPRPSLNGGWVFPTTLLSEPGLSSPPVITAERPSDLQKQLLIQRPVGFPVRQLVLLARHMTDRQLLESL